MPGKVFKLIGKTLHPDGYYTASILSTSEASDEAVSTPKIKLWFRFNKGLIIGPEQREKLIREEQEHAAAAAAAKANEEIPTPSVVLLVKEVDQAKTTAAVSTHHHAVSTSSSFNYSTFQSKLDATKRKMHDSYQQRANAKKQRMIQVIDPCDLPPQPSLKGKGNVVTARKKMITANRKTRNNNNNNFFDGGGRSKLMKPTSIF